MAFEKTAEGAPKPAMAKGADVTASEAPKPATGKTTDATTSEAAKPPTEKVAELTMGEATSRPADEAAGEAVVSAIPPPQDRFLLHLASHRTQAKAALEWELLTRKFAALLGDLQPIIRSVDLGDRGVFYRVQAGPIGSRASARALCRQFKARDQYCRVFRYR